VKHLKSQKGILPLLNHFLNFLNNATTVYKNKTYPHRFTSHLKAFLHLFIIILGYSVTQCLVTDAPGGPTVSFVVLKYNLI